MNQTILITGASRGIGFALTSQLLKSGFNVIGASRTRETPLFSHENFEAITLDLSDSKSIQEVERFLSKRQQNIDILINNAGIGPDLDFALAEEKTFRQTFEVNTTGVVLLTETLCPHIVEGGKIINISSKMGSIKECLLSGSVAYRMSKAALNMYTKILANRLSGQQSVASIHPGWVRTTISKSNTNGRLSADESASRIIDFILSDFKTAAFWDVETQRHLEW